MSAARTIQEAHCARPLTRGGMASHSQRMSRPAWRSAKAGRVLGNGCHGADRMGQACRSLRTRCLAGMRHDPRQQRGAVPVLQRKHSPSASPLRCTHPAQPWHALQHAGAAPSCRADARLALVSMHLNRPSPATCALACWTAACSRCMSARKRPSDSCRGGNPLSASPTMYQEPLLSRTTSGRLPLARLHVRQGGAAAAVDSDSGGPAGGAARPSTGAAYVCRAPGAWPPARSLRPGAHSWSMTSAMPPMSVRQ